MRRLFYTFAHGVPAAGLLLMRFAAGSSLLAPCVQSLVAGSLTLGWPAVMAVVGVLLLIGLWTPVAGAFAAVYAAAQLISNPGDTAYLLLLCALSVALTLLGPGGWSLDSRLFGWKRIDIHTDD